MIGVQEPIMPPNERPKRLIVAGASARSAAWSAAQAGFEIIAIDLFGDRDLRSICDFVYVIPGANYPHGIRDLVRQVGDVDAWLYTGGLENYPRLVDQISEHTPLLGNAGDVLNQVRNPEWLADIYDAAGIPCPRVLPDPSIVRASNATGLTGEKRWLSKPIRSAAGSRIEFADPIRSPVARNTYFQEFLDGPTYSAVYLAEPAADGIVTARLVGVTRLWTARDQPNNACESKSFQYLGSSGPVGLSPSLRTQWQNVGDCLVANANLRGLFGVDAVVVDSDENPTVCPIEVNPRYTASTEILERAMHYSLIGAHVDTFAKNYQTTVATKSDSYWGKRIRFAETTVTICDEIHTLFPSPSSIKSWVLADIPHDDVTSPIQVGDPILTTLAEASSLNEVEHALGFRELSDT